MAATSSDLALDQEPERYAKEIQGWGNTPMKRMYSGYKQRAESDSSLDLVKATNSPASPSRPLYMFVCLGGLERHSWDFALSFR